MNDAWFDRSADQRREKARSWNRSIEKYRTNITRQVRVAEKLKFLEALDEVLADKPATRPPILVDTLGGGVQVGDEAGDSVHEEDDNDGKTNHMQTNTSSDEAESVSVASADKST